MPSAEACLPSSPFRLPGGQAAGRLWPLSKVAATSLVRVQGALMRMRGEINLTPISTWRVARTESCQPSPDLCHLPEWEAGGRGGLPHPHSSLNSILSSAKSTCANFQS